MMMNHYEFLNFLVTHDITAEQYLICYTVMIQHDGKANHQPILNLAKKYRGTKKVKFVPLIENLIEKGFIENNNPKGEIKIKSLYVTEKFKNLLYVDIDLCFKQALAVYPDYIEANGTRYASKMYDKGTEALKKLYYTNVTKEGMKSEHELFIKLIKAEYPAGTDANMKFDKLLLNWDTLKDQLYQKYRIKVKVHNPYDRQL